MNRQQAIELIEDHRAEQDRLWPRDEANPHREQYKHAAPHILIIEEKVARLRALWYESSKELLRAEFVKIGALAVRALEEIEQP